LIVDQVVTSIFIKILECLIIKTLFKEMKMFLRCKVGDLAVIVKSAAGNEGKIVRVVKFVGQAPSNHVPYNDMWEIDRKLPTNKGNLIDQISDSMLRPIQDSDLDDEALDWAGHPTKELEYVK
jgi:hypothetical protein